MQALSGMIFCAALAAVPAIACAQISEQRLINSAAQARDLEFPTKLSSFSMFSSPQMALYKPEGAGPFPALVLFHQCGGLSSQRWQNVSMLTWAKEAVSRGYVALLIDGFSQRNVDSTCFGPKNGVNLMRNAKDALQAAEHLRKLDFVDKKRVGLAGYSHGAMVGLLASSRQSIAAFGGDGFNAVVSFYPGCFTIQPATGNPYELIHADTERPLLVLMGDQDNETPPADCVARLTPLRTAGKPVEWHVYPATTHCWDCENLNGATKVDARGNRVVYRYSREVTQDSARRMFEFLQEKMPAL